MMTKLTIETSAALKINSEIGSKFSNLRLNANQTLTNAKNPSDITMINRLKLDGSDKRIF